MWFTRTYTSILTSGLGAAEADPLSGSVIANFEGTENVTTLVCNITGAMGRRDITSWSITNFRGVSERRPLLTTLAPELFQFGGDPIPETPSFTFQNRLTILRLTSELDEVVIYCGFGGSPAQANFILRLFRKSMLRYTIDNREGGGFGKMLYSAYAPPQQCPLHNLV